MNNMNTNMPLMMILQQGQDQAEEQEMRRECEEEMPLWEVQMRAEDQQRSDQMHLYMMAMLSKMTGIPLDKPPAHFQNTSGSDEASYPIAESPLEVHGPLLQSLCDEMAYLTEEKAKMLNQIRNAKAHTSVQTKEICEFTKAMKAKDAILAQLKQCYLKELEAIEQVLPSVLTFD
ncbi:hypothetical protein O181_062008 [Austropuccinia psidii MF-1]|uniref:Uncharacterized protein n=1 Tax=Austropuccinia psidii MF-1 TaxID=1389203 RepID=A0A9Q3HZ41_9BASI|nr:hypothetical protein [Austropuccinia psidii MF-1]